MIETEPDVWYHPMVKEQAEGGGVIQLKDANCIIMYLIVLSLTYVS